MPTHQAFLDLERALSDRLRARWDKYWAKFSKELVQLIEAGDQDGALNYAATFDLAPLINRLKPHIKTLSVAGMLLGASRVRPVRDIVGVKSSTADAPVSQAHLMLSDNATASIRELLINHVTAAFEIRKQELPLDVSKIAQEGYRYFDLLSSLHISRTSAMGFLIEAAEAGIEFYEVDAILDAKTCEVCRHLDGVVFPVTVGLAQAELIAQATSREALKSIAPFYAQNKGSINRLKGYETSQLIEQGLSMPPYHPFCRCILVPSKASSKVDPTDSFNRVVGAVTTLYGDTQLLPYLRDLFGIQHEPRTVESDLSVAEVVDGLPEEVASEHRVEDFGRSTIPSRLGALDPRTLARVATSKWPWLALLLGWLATREQDQQQDPLEEDEDLDDDELLR